MARAVILDALRTPIGRYGGVLSTVRPDDLAAHVVRAAVRRNGLDPAAVDELYLGNTNGAGEDNRNVARMAGLLAGLPVEVPAATVNRLCASGLEAAVQGARQIRLEEAGLVLAGGVESMSRAPLVTLKPERGFARGNLELVDTTIGWRFVNPRMPDAHIQSLGETAENVAERYSVSREDQDAFALESHRRAVAAADAGRLDDEIVAVDVPQPKGEAVTVHSDEGPRRNTSIEQLASLRPIFREGGSVTAGNSSQINDGAACLVLASEERARELSREPLARIVSSGAAGVDPAFMGGRPDPRRAQGATRRRAGGLGHRAGRAQRGLRLTGPGLDARAGLRAREGQRQRRGDRSRPPAWLLRRPPARHARLGTAPPRRALRRVDDVRRGGDGHGGGHREPGGLNRDGPRPRRGPYLDSCRCDAYPRVW
jgi:acetyl-CoA acyltransferase